MNNSTMTSTPLPQPPTETMSMTIKMEQLENYDSPSPTHESFSNSSEPSHTPEPESHGSKPVKKRKSWGQVLPEPKTTLPPRKRAKTEDEKEQRRIERVKRNRLAAHNSRERKRQEYEVLQTEKDQMEADLQSYKQRLAQMEAELLFYRSKYPGEAPEPVFDFATHTSPIDTFDTVCPAQTSTSFPSPVSMDSMDSPRDSSCQPETPISAYETVPDFDSTQYSAAVLCDLQCQSISGTSAPAIWAYLTLFNLTLQSTRSLLLSTTTSSTLTSSLKSAVAHRQRLLLLTWNPLTAWLILISSMALVQHYTTSVLPPTLTAILTALMQSSRTCRVPLAQLRLATRPSQGDFSRKDVEGSSKGVIKAESVGAVLGPRLMRSSRLRQLGRRKSVHSLRLGRVLGRENLECGITRRQKAL
ncbi:hypothetical protein EJ02DRAFT_449250 [Clathrospora elynae]|uniref:BZIP domain-containing protein n=1 Tax=Clathrospora elynae TaxID=706981 RepID=A0A6A5TAI3_9PLEO|nr:hypothetical protein EJ02DRAFT_449250 [Clathrospora elynae]